MDRSVAVTHPTKVQLMHSASLRNELLALITKNSLGDPGDRGGRSVFYLQNLLKRGSKLESIHPAVAGPQRQ
jgi:hypothetical protein